MDTHAPENLPFEPDGVSGWKEAATAFSRRFARFGARGQARLIRRAPEGSVTSLQGQVRDISRGGIGMVTTDRLELGELWDVQIMQGTLVIASHPAACRFCKQLDNGLFLIGMEFGIESSVLLALGVSAADIAEGDDPEFLQPDTGDFLSPDALLDGE